MRVRGRLWLRGGPIHEAGGCGLDMNRYRGEQGRGGGEDLGAAGDRGGGALETKYGVFEVGFERGGFGVCVGKRRG